jgi:predicted helicase
MHGFEILVGPYAVAHLRLTQALEGAINDAKEEGEPEEKLERRLRIYLADTLESPNAAPPGGLTLTYKALTEEHESARRVKQGGDILVCLGNPPYDRQQIEEGDTRTKRKGGWVRFGEQIEGGAKHEKQGERPIFKDFSDPATQAGAGVHLKNLYNDYVYFWRWALWRLFEQQACGGIVTFITASSFLGGPAFIGMREYMRREFDEIYVINLGGDLLGTRKTPNVFNIQTPVAITIGVRSGTRDTEKAAEVRYMRVEAENRADKLSALEKLDKIGTLPWESVSNGWRDPFYPRSSAVYFFWPELANIFPWQHSGSQFKRVWPIGENAETLLRRWKDLCSAPPEGRKKLFKETRDRKISRSYSDFSGSPSKKLMDITLDESAPIVSRYCYRPFDRQYAFIDNRLGDYIRPPLVKARGERNLFFASLMTKMLGVGGAITATSELPDLDVFCGRGGKDIIPLYRDGAGTDPNICDGLLDALSKEYGAPTTPEDLAAYVYAALGGQSYTRRFWNELETPGPRVPLTKDGKIFAETVKLGRKLIWLHTYAERFRGGDLGDEVPTGLAKVIKGVSGNPAQYPESYSYDSGAGEIIVGDGRFGPVSSEVWQLEVSGLKVVQSWLGYRMKRRAGKKSSPLDLLRPERWTARMSEEFLELIWVLEATLAMEPALEAQLDKIIASSCFTSEEMPAPKDDERKAPDSAASTAGGLLGLMGVEAADDEDDDFDDEGISAEYGELG